MSSPDRDLDNSRPLDVHRWSEHPEVKSLLDDIWSAYFAEHFDALKTGPKPKGRPKQQYKVLLLDLYVCWGHDKEQCLGVPLANGSFKAGSRYNALHISDLLSDIVKHAVEAKLIDVKKGSEASGKVTRIWPSALLVEKFEKAQFSIFDISHSEKQEVIILNKKEDPTSSDSMYGKKAKSIEYDDGDFAPIPEMRQQLKDYNALLARTFVDIGTLEQPWVERECWDKQKNKMIKQRVRILQDNKFVRRIFARGDWLLGGRFYGGFWQQVGEEYRKHILIDDKRTVEVDYSGFHVNLCYALKGIKPPGDPYLIPEILFKDIDQIQQRNAIKTLSLCVINAKDRTSTYQAFRNEQKTGSILKKLKNKDLAYALDAFMELHSPIAEFICTDKGVELQNLDGKITARIIDTFTQRKVPILTIHDSYIVPDGEDNSLIEQMDKAISRLLPEGRVPIKPNKVGVGQSIGMWNQHPVTPYERNQGLRQAFNTINSDVIRCKGYGQRHRQWRSWME